jgi:hypothetical protein
MQAATLPSPLPTLDVNVNCHEINDASDRPYVQDFRVSVSGSYQRGAGSIHTFTVAKTISEMSSATASWSVSNGMNSGFREIEVQVRRKIAANHA